VLLYKSPLSKTAQKRLQVLRDSNDGFVIAQKTWKFAVPASCSAPVRPATLNLKSRTYCAIRP
jgi:ATP-dependent DNA helicase RecG